MSFDAFPRKRTRLSAFLSLGPAVSVTIETPCDRWIDIVEGGGERRRSAGATPVLGGHVAVDPKWYLVKTKPLNEPRVFARLTEAGYETLFPKILKKNRRTGQMVSRPFFPTYLFVRFVAEQTRTIRYTRGVAKVVSFGPLPEEVNPEIVDAVRGRMDGEGFITLIQAPVTWKRGERIRIGEGPLAGIDAIFLEELPDRERVVLLLDAISSFKVTIGKDAIER